MSSPSVSRRQWLAGLAATAAATAALPSALHARASRRSPEPMPTPAEALERLVSGNGRFVNGQMRHPHEDPAWRQGLASGQHPFATIFGCVDSRVPPELVFDAGLGDLFVIRTAGTVLDDATLGSLEFGVEELHIPIIMVLGHERCGAVKATIDILEQRLPAPDRINFLVNAIEPALSDVRPEGGDLVDKCVRRHVTRTVERLRATPILRHHVDEGKLLVLGARYDLDFGTVELLPA